jgi:hypothetical protein
MKKASRFRNSAWWVALASMVLCNFLVLPIVLSFVHTEWRNARAPMFWAYGLLHAISLIGFARGFRRLKRSSWWALLGIVNPLVPLLLYCLLPDLSGELGPSQP